MTNKIQTKIFNYGNEKESVWPGQFGTGESGSFWWDEKTQTFKQGYPPPKNLKFGEAPYVIQDTIEPYRHPSTGEIIESRSRLRDTDEACGTITTDKKIPPDPSKFKENERKRRADLREALYKSVAQIDSGTAPLSEETRAICARENERVSKALNFDAFNVAGRKNDRRGKKYRRR